MTTRAEPPDPEPDEEPIAELSVLIPEPDDRFAAEIERRLDQHSLAKNVTVASVWGILAAFIQLFAAVSAIFGIGERTGSNQEDDHA